MFAKTRNCLNTGWFAVIALSFLSMLGCRDDGVAAIHSLHFDPVEVPVSDVEKRGILASRHVIVDGRQYPLQYRTLIRSGEDINGTVFGTITDRDGVPIGPAGTPRVSNYADFSSLLPAGNRLFMVTHLETVPAAMYLTELKQDGDTGLLKVLNTRSIDFSPVQGLYTPCAGSVTPWHTHLGGEEYEPDARAFESATDEDLGSAQSKVFLFKNMARYFGIKPTSAKVLKETLNPYHYGWPVEVAVDASGATDVRKHYAMGRRSLELAYVMPDKKTVYLSDDGTNVGLYLFVADHPGDLGAGVLYAAKWHQLGDQDGGNAALEWIGLGRASDAEIKASLDAGTRFSDIFDTEAPGDDGSCATPQFTAVNTSNGNECLRLRPGMNTAASRLETRRYAAMLGATTEFSKEEGITFDPDGGRLFVSISYLEKGMTAAQSENDAYNKGSGDHIRLTPNSCGAVYGLDLGNDASIGSNYVAKNMHAVIVGKPRQYDADSPYAGNNTCDVDWLANPDNLTFIPGQKTLIVGEDSSTGHQNDMLWAYNVDTGALTRILATPYGAEVTSPYFYPDIHGYAYLMSVVQHPYGESDKDKATSVGDSRAYVGYIGPLPKIF